ncbi:MAG: glycosyltransferase family 61 protein [Leptolyngbya sp. ERB_1_1]
MQLNTLSKNQPSRFPRLNRTALKRYSLRLLLGKQSYSDLCDTQRLLCKAEEKSTPSALFLEGDLENVTAVQPNTTFERELKRVLGGKVEIPASIVYPLKDVTLIQGYLYKGALKEPLVTTPEDWLISNETVELNEATLACSYCGNLYFGHWMRDDLTVGLLARQFAPAVRTHQVLTQHQTEYSEVTDIKPTPMSQAHFQQLYVFDDSAQNELKRQRYQTIRAMFRNLSNSISSHPGILLLRGNSGAKRILTNETEVADYLQKQGFTMIDPEKTSALEIIQQSLGARIVVGVEGSQLAHGIFSMADQGGILTLQPPYRFNNIYKEYADCLEMKYGFIVGEQVEDGFQINLDRLDQLLHRF